VKLPRLIVALLLLNLCVFCGILAYFVRSQRGLETVLETGPAPASEEPAEPAPLPPPSETQVIVVTNRVDWAQLESEDYKTYIARLRAIGCPEQTIRDIIIADLDKVMAPQLQAIYGRRKELKYWHSEEEELANEVDPRDITRQERALEKQKRDILRELVNADLTRERMKQKGQEDYLERRLGFIDEDKRSALRDVLEKFDEAEQSLRTKELDEGEALTAGERAALAQLRRERDAELARLLNPQERAQYELWLSPTANTVRRALYGLNAGEDEFLAIYQARKTFDDTWGAQDPLLLDAEGRAQHERARLELEENLRRRLGDKRYAEYKRGEDEDFHQMNLVVTRYKLPRETAAEVYGMKKVVSDFRQQVRVDASLTSAQREAALKAMTEETEATVKTMLGDRAFRFYLRAGAGQWMRE
jgi:hypothetical protein